jgi:hypothetical protein
MRVDDLEEVSAASTGSLGRTFVAALAAKDAAGLLAVFGDEVDFQAMTPGRVWQPQTPAEVVGDVILGAWFEPSDVIERIEAVQTGIVGDRHRLGYRLQVTSPDGRFTVEQQAFFDVTAGRITWMRLLCSGFRTLAA